MFFYRVLYEVGFKEKRMKDIIDQFDGSIQFSNQVQQNIQSTDDQDIDREYPSCNQPNYINTEIPQIQNLHSNPLLTSVLPTTTISKEPLDFALNSLPTYENTDSSNLKYDLNNQYYNLANLLPPAASGDITTQFQQFQQIQHLQQLQQLQQLQHLQQLQNLTNQRVIGESQLNINNRNSEGTNEIDPNLFDMIQHQLQLQLQLDIQRQNQINHVMSRVSSPLLKSKTVAGVSKSVSKLKKTTQPKEFKCTHCQWIFNRHSDLTRHLKSHNAPEYHCPFWHPEFETCPHKNKGSFSRLDILKRHLKLVHFHLFKNSNDQDQKIKRRNGGECLSCGRIFSSMKDFIDHVGECALTTPMKRWRFRKNGVIVNVSKDFDELLDDEDEELTRSGSDPINASKPLAIEDEDEDEFDKQEIKSYYHNSSLKKRMDYGNKMTYLDLGDHETIVKNVIPALKRPRGRPKKYST